MTTDEPAPHAPTVPPADAEDAYAQRQADLWELHRLLIKALLEALKEPKVRASMLDVARSFLRENGITAKHAPGIRRGLAKLAEGNGLLPFDA